MAESPRNLMTMQPGEQEQDQGITTPRSATEGELSGFVRLAPECRNIVYGMVFESPSHFFIVAADGLSRRFRLRQRSDKLQYEAVAALQALCQVSQMIRHEARTLFYASKHFLVLPYGYEYLPVFVHWLESIGPECRAVVRTLCLAGYM